PRRQRRQQPQLYRQQRQPGARRHVNRRGRRQRPYRDRRPLDRQQQRDDRHHPGQRPPGGDDRPDHLRRLARSRFLAQGQRAVGQRCRRQQRQRDDHSGGDRRDAVGDGRRQRSDDRQRQRHRIIADLGYRRPAQRAARQ